MDFQYLTHKGLYAHLYFLTRLIQLKKVFLIHKLVRSTIKSPMEMTNAINWFEIPVSDYDRAKQFYCSIYEYEMVEMDMQGTKMGMLPHDPASGGIGGAICYGEGYTPSTEGAKVYLNGGKDLNVVLGRVESAGGQVIMEKTKITDEIGYFAIFADTEGNQVSLHSPG